MAQLPWQTGFDANTVAPSSPKGAIPAGDYSVMIIESEMKDTKASGGQMLVLVNQVIDGPHKGAKLWTRLNLVNKSQQAVEIAQAELSSVCRAVGVMTVTDSSALHNIPYLAKVTAKLDNGDLRNDIVGWSKSYGSAPVQAEPQAVPDQPNPNTQPATATEPPKQPWAR